MARLPRYFAPQVPLHIILRGNDRNPIVGDEDDLRFLRTTMSDAAKRHDLAIHAYVLMTNHFHLLATPQTERGLPLLMQAVGRSYVRYFNDLQIRTGTLWEGRYRSTLIETDRYLLACMAYIDLNPVRTGMVSEARDYPWSSHGFYVGLRSDKLVTPHALFWGLANTPFGREVAYADLVRAGVSAQQQADLTRSTLAGWALGEDCFVANLQKTTERRITMARAGRPFNQPHKIKR